MRALNRANTLLLLNRGKKETKIAEFLGTDDEIVSIPHYARVSPECGFQLLFKPQIQDIVQVNVGEDG